MACFEELLIDQVKQHEGLSLVPYEDTEGHLTIGWGHLLAKGIPLHVAHALLKCDVLEAIEDLDKNKPWWRGLPLDARLVVADMNFNLGWSKFKEFVKFWTALELHNYGLAAKEMIDSRWYRQVKSRGVKLVAMMERIDTNRNKV